MSVAVPLRLASVPVAGLVAVDEAEANALLVEWGHYLEACDRPFRNEAFVLDVRGEPVAVAITSSIVSPTVTDERDVTYSTRDVVELSRLCSKPGENWATRVTLRLWRETAAPFYLPWTPKAAIAYSKNDRHEGRIYRFDGWTRVRSTAGSSGGGAWSRKRYAGDAAHGPKTLWIWKVRVSHAQFQMFGDPVELEPLKPELTDRQQHALQLLQHAGRAGLTVDEVGAAWCERRGKHSADTRCTWCGQNGRDVLKALRRKGKVKQRRDGSGTWYALEGLVEPEPADRGEIPF